MPEHWLLDLQCPNIGYLNRMMKLVITLSKKPLQFFIMWLLVADKGLLDYYLLTGIYLQKMKENNRDESER